jgi:hypothetical protein
VEGEEGRVEEFKSLRVQEFRKAKKKILTQRAQRGERRGR